MHNGNLYLLYLILIGPKWCLVANSRSKKELKWLTMDYVEPTILLELYQEHHNCAVQWYPDCTVGPKFRLILPHMETI